MFHIRIGGSCYNETVQSFRKFVLDYLIQTPNIHQIYEQTSSENIKDLQIVHPADYKETEKVLCHTHCKL